MTMLKTTAAAGLILLAASPAGAQPPMDGIDDAPVVSELVVPSAAGGPAWWRVSDEDSRVYILVIPRTAPRSLDWDRTLLERRLAGANRLYLPIGISLNPASLLGVANVATKAPRAMKELGARERPKGDKTSLEDKLPPDIRERFVAMRTKIGKPAADYEALMPDAAAQKIEEDYRAWAGMGPGPLATIRAAARKNRVPDQAIAKFTVPVTRLDVVITGKGGPACMAQTLDRMERAVAEEKRLAQAWANGDPRPLISPNRKPEEPVCRSVSVGASGAKGKAIWEGLVKDQVRTIAAALKRPGKAVVVIEGREMFIADGVLTRLKAMGYEVTAPDVLKE